MDNMDALYASALMVLITQVFRQLLPNCFAFPWQLGICYFVPSKFRKMNWFSNKNSLLFFSEDERLFHTYNIKTQSNLRSIVLMFGLSFWIFTRFSTTDILLGWDAIVTLIITAIMIAVPIKVASEGFGKFNPDYILYLVFSGSGLLVALDFILVNF
jgi:hypothetical protein